MLKIYSINCDPDALILVDGKLVLNGGYECIKHKDGTLGLPNIRARAYFVGNVPSGWTGSYNSIIERFKKLRQR